MPEAYPPDRTALLFVDPYNDFVAEKGLIANTCIESTGRFASELGSHVTLVRDATAAASQEATRSAHDINGPTFAHAIATTAELLSSLQRKTA